MIPKFFPNLSEQEKHWPEWHASSFTSFIVDLNQCKRIRGLKRMWFKCLSNWRSLMWFLICGLVRPGFQCQVNSVRTGMGVIYTGLDPLCLQRRTSAPRKGRSVNIGSMNALTGCKPRCTKYFQNWTETHTGSCFLNASRFFCAQCNVLVNSLKHVIKLIVTFCHHKVFQSIRDHIILR